MMAVLFIVVVVAALLMLFVGGHVWWWQGTEWIPIPCLEQLLQNVIIVIIIIIIIIIIMMMMMMMMMMLLLIIEFDPGHRWRGDAVETTVTIIAIIFLRQSKLIDSAKSNSNRKNRL